MPMACDVSEGPNAGLLVGYIGCLALAAKFGYRYFRGLRLYSAVIGHKSAEPDHTIPVPLVQT